MARILAVVDARHTGCAEVQNRESSRVYDANYKAVAVSYIHIKSYHEQSDPYVPRKSYKHPAVRAIEVSDRSCKDEFR